MAKSATVADKQTRSEAIKNYHLRILIRSECGPVGEVSGQGGSCTTVNIVRQPLRRGARGALD